MTSRSLIWYGYFSIFLIAPYIPLQKSQIIHTTWIVDKRYYKQKHILKVDNIFIFRVMKVKYEEKKSILVLLIEKNIN